jgi:hypothetical protein
MRVYVPADWDRLATLQARGSVPGPLAGYAVDPGWRAGAPDVDEEEWEYVAAELAAESLALPGGGRGLVLAVDLDEELTPFDDGRVEVSGPVARRQVAAVLDAELAWFGLQELAELLAAARS